MLAEKKELLKRALLEARLKELETVPSTEILEQEHVFSLAFEKKMKSITDKNKFSRVIKKAGKYVAGFAVICVLTGSAFLVIQSGGMFFDKFGANDAAGNECLEEPENSFTNDFVAEEITDNIGNNVCDEELLKDFVYGSNDGIFSNFYNDNGSIVIEINYADSEVLSAGVTGSNITYAPYEAVTNGETGDGDYSNNATSTSSSLYFRPLDKELYDTVVDTDVIKYIIDNSQAEKLSKINIFIETETVTVMLSYMVDRADGTLSLIEQ